MDLVRINLEENPSGPPVFSIHWKCRFCGTHNHFWRESSLLQEETHFCGECGKQEVYMFPPPVERESAILSSNSH